MMNDRMNRLSRRRLLLLWLIMSMTSLTYAQLRVTRVTSPEGLAGRKGVVYTLPASMLIVEVEILKTQAVPGPLADYAKDFLGIGDAITRGNLTYSLQQGSIRVCQVPDPNHTYLVEKEEKSSGEIWISFDGAGPVMSMEKFTRESRPQGFMTWDKDLYFTPQADKLFRKYSEASTREVIDTIIRKISIDTLVIEEKVFKRSMVGFNDREKALEASDRIRQIEQDKYNLLIGYQETPYSREALEFMYGKLEEEQREYRKLFTGVELSETLSFRFEVYPDPLVEEQAYMITGFSRSNGIVPADSQNAIMLELKRGPRPAGPAEIPGAGFTGLVFRNPAQAVAVLKHSGKEIVNQRIEIMQFGTIYTLPPEFKRVSFDTETGRLKAIVLE